MESPASVRTEDLVRKNGVSGVGWEHFAHGADIGVRGYGLSLEEAFEQAALALAAVGRACHPENRGHGGLRGA